MKCFSTFFLLLFSVCIFSQVQIPATGFAHITFDDFNGSGFAPEPLAGQLDSDYWEIIGLSDSTLNYGYSLTTGDFARGLKPGGVTPGGIYSFIVDTDNHALGIQPVGTDFTPGSITLRLINSTGGIINTINIEYEIWCLNDQGKSNSFNFEYSSDGSDFSPMPALDFTSPLEADPAPVWVRTDRAISIPVNIAPNAMIYLRWKGNEIAGSGSMDEFALDDIRVSANENPTPVELNLFRGSLNGQNVELFWQTITEINNYGFEVQKQAKGIEQSAKWETIGFIEGAGNSNAPKEYSFIDNTPVAERSRSYRLKQIDLDGSFTYSNEITVEAASSVPTEFSLSQNYPNPFNPVTTIKYSISESPLSGGVRGGFVTLKIFNLLGQEVATIVNQQQPAGNYEVKFDASKLASGVYLYKLQAGDFSSVKKLILMK